MPDDSKKSTWRDILRLVLPLYLPAFIFSFSQSLLIPVLPLFAQEFEISYTLIGVVLAGDAIGMLIGDLPAGMLLRRLGQKSTMLIGVTLTAVSTVGLYFVQSVAVVVLCRVAAGLGVALFAVSRHFFLAEMVPVAQRGRLISLFGGLYRLGRLLGPLIGGVMGAAFGLRSSFLLFGVLCVATMIIVTFLLPYIEVVHQDEKAVAKPRGGYFIEMLKSQYLMLLKAGSGQLFLAIIRSGPAAIVPLYASNYLGMDVQTIGLVMSLSAALDMALFYPAGILMDRKGRKYAIVSCALVMTVGMGLIPIAGGFFSLLAAGMIAGLGNGLGSGSMLILGSDLAPRNGRGEFLGAWNLIGDVGGTSGPMMVGALADVIPLPLTAWVVASTGLIAGLIFYWLVPETLRKTTQPVVVNS